MIKKTLCIVFAALLVFGMCACANNGRTVQPTDAPKTTAAPDITAVPATQAPENYDPYEGLGDDTVLVAVDGLVSGGITVAQAKQLKLVEFERDEEDTPALSGILLKDLIALVGAENAKSITVNYDAEVFAKSFDLDKIDMDTAAVYFLRNGMAIGEGKGVLILTDADGFEYTLEIDRPLTLG